MKGLLIKDMYVLKSQLRLYVFLTVIWLLVSFTNRDASFFTGLLAILIYLIPISALSYEDKAKLTSYTLTMPYSRKDIVVEKYLIGFIIAPIGIVLSIIVGIFLKANITSSISSALIIIGIGLIIMDFAIPLVYKFGYDKARILMIILVALTCCLMPMFMPRMIDKEESLTTINFTLVGVIVFAVSVLLSALSILLSINIVNKKEY